MYIRNNWTNWWLIWETQVHISFVASSRTKWSSLVQWMPLLFWVSSSATVCSRAFVSAVKDFLTACITLNSSNGMWAFPYLSVSSLCPISFLPSLSPADISVFPIKPTYISTILSHKLLSVQLPDSSSKEAGQCRGQQKSNRDHFISHWTWYQPLQDRSHQGKTVI